MDEKEEEGKWLADIVPIFTFFGMCVKVRMGGCRHSDARRHSKVHLAAYSFQ